MEGVDTAFYLVHSMSSKEGFEEEDRRAATAFGAAAHRAGVKKMFIWAASAKAMGYPLTCGAGRKSGAFCVNRERQRLNFVLRSSWGPEVSPLR
jgi:hypothetical protein